jgi:hypothetical protein
MSRAVIPAEAGIQDLQLKRTDTDTLDSGSSPE